MSLADILAEQLSIEIPQAADTHHGWGKLAYLVNYIYGTKFTALELKAEMKKRKPR